MFTRKPNRTSEKPAAVETITPDPIRKVETPAPSSPTPAKFSTPLKGSGQMAPSVIGEDLSVEGNVISKGEVQVEGEIKGDIHCTSIVIGDKALIEGGVIADDVIVRGRVMGTVRGQRVTLQSTSHVDGDIFHQSLAIEQGAYFEGKSRRSDDPLADAKSSLKSKSGLGAGGNSTSSAPGDGKPSKSTSTTE